MLKLTMEQEAFLEELVNRHTKNMEKYCMRCFRYDSRFMPCVADCVQRAFFRAAKNIEKLMEHENAGGWLARACLFEVQTELRTASRRKEQPVAYIPERNREELYAAFDQWSREITLQDVQEAVAKILAEGEQKIFNDYFLHGYSTAETAQRNQVSDDTVRGKVYRMRRKLKNHLKDCFFQMYIILIVFNYTGWKR